MTNINKTSPKTSKKDFLRVPDVASLIRFDTVYFRFILHGKDCKVSTGVRIPKGGEIDNKTGIIKGNPALTKQILVYRERFDNAFRQSILEGREPSIDFLKCEMFGINNHKQTPTLIKCLELYFEFTYGETTQMDSKTKEKNGYSLRNIIEWTLHELGKTSELTDVKPIHAEIILNSIMSGKNVSREHARRSVGFLDRTLKFAVKSGWLTSNPFQYVLTEKIFQRQSKEITKYLTLDELHKIETVEIHVKELAQFRDWFVLACHTGLEWHTFKSFQKSWICYDENGNLYLDGKRFKPNGERFEPFTLPLSRKAKNLITKFLAESNPNSELLFGQIRHSNTYVNRLLKQIDVLADVNRQISFNFGRKTFATNAINSGIRAEIIQRMLGHTKIDTTLRHYAKVNKNTILKEGIF